MKNYLHLTVLLMGLVVPQTIFAAQIVFSVSPNTIPGDNAVILDVSLIPEGDESINTIEGRIGILGVGAESVTDVIIESGDSLFTLWPAPPTYQKEGKIIRFTGGVPSSVTDEGKILGLRLFTNEESPVTVSWLGGLAYQDDGLGTPVGISSRSITFVPQSGTPNKIRSTSEDTKPPSIHSIEISHDVDVFEGRNFLSIHATDDITGVSYYEVIEDGEVTRVESGPYQLRNQTMHQPLHITVYDKAGNSISVKYPEEKINLFKLGIGALLFLLIVTSILKYFKII